jgi:hypothetical protein
MHFNVSSELISISECTLALIVQSTLSYSQCDFSNSLDGFGLLDLQTFEFHRLVLEFTNDERHHSVEGRATSQERQAAVQQGRQVTLVHRQAALSHKTYPTKTDLSKTGPTKTDPSTTTKTGPTKTGPTKTDPSTTDPTKTDPTKTDPSKIDLSKADPTKTDPSTTDPSENDPTKALNSRMQKKMGEIVRQAEQAGIDISERLKDF